MQTIFTQASVLLPAVNETYSLEETVQQIEASSSQDVREYIFLICHKTTPQCLQAIEKVRAWLPSNKTQLINQTLPFLGGALREGFQAARGSHTIMMASDLETNPSDVSRLIQAAKKNPEKIITASRWISGGEFIGYGNIKFFCNLIFQRLFSLLYRTHLSDMTYGFRIFPTELVKKIHWEELRHPFLFETLIKPLRLGISVEEVPTTWKARTEGVSQNTFFRNFVYFYIGIKTLFRKKSEII